MLSNANDMHILLIFNSRQTVYENLPVHIRVIEGGGHDRVNAITSFVIPAKL